MGSQAAVLHNCDRCGMTTVTIDRDHKDIPSGWGMLLWHGDHDRIDYLFCGACTAAIRAFMCGAKLDAMTALEVATNAS